MSEAFLYRAHYIREGKARTMTFAHHAGLERAKAFARLWVEDTWGGKLESVVAIRKATVQLELV